MNGIARLDPMIELRWAVGILLASAGMASGLLAWSYLGLEPRTWAVAAGLGLITVIVIVGARKIAERWKWLIIPATGASFAFGYGSILIRGSKQHLAHIPTAGQMLSALVPILMFFFGVAVPMTVAFVRKRAE